MDLFHVALIVLVEGRLIMCDRDKSKTAAWDRKSVWLWELDAIIVPFMEATFVFFPAADKSMMIFHHIVPFVAINIHSVFQLPIPPA